MAVSVLIFFMGDVEPREDYIWLFLDSLEDSTNSKYPLCAREYSGYIRGFREPSLYDTKKLAL